MSDMGFIGGEATQRVLGSLEQGHRMSAEEAWRVIQEDQTPLWKRLSRYVVGRDGGSCDEDAVTCAYRAQDILKERGAAKGFPRDSWRKNVEKWTDRSLMVRSLDPESIFKLCLALDLSLEEAREFVWDQLYQDWFSYRSQEELVYQYFIARQQDYGSEAYGRALELIDELENLGNDADQAFLSIDDADELGIATTTSMTKSIKDTFDSIATSEGGEKGLRRFQDFLSSNKPQFDRVRHSGLRYYTAYAADGVKGISSLLDYYKLHYEIDENWENPALKEYYNGKDDNNGKDKKSSQSRKRRKSNNGNEQAKMSSQSNKWRDKNKGRSLFDAAAGGPFFPIDALSWRKEWRDNFKKVARALNDRSVKDEPNYYDPIPSHLFNGERHGAILRGNLIALLFLQQCAAESLRSADRESTAGHQKNLFNRFFKEANFMLSECCMLPLHPRNSFDRLFLQAMARDPDDVESDNSADYFESQVKYLNDTLSYFYPLPAAMPEGEQDVKAWERYHQQLLAPYRH